MKRAAGRTMLHAGFLFRLILNPEGGGGMFSEELVDFQRSTQGYITEYGRRSTPRRGKRRFSALQHPDRLWVLPSLLSNGYRGPFPWG
jgi:hypothetical protein